MRNLKSETRTIRIEYFELSFHITLFKVDQNARYGNTTFTMTNFFYWHELL